MAQDLAEQMRVQAEELLVERANMKQAWSYYLVSDLTFTKLSTPSTHISNVRSGHATINATTLKFVKFKT